MVLESHQNVFLIQIYRRFGFRRIRDTRVRDIEIRLYVDCFEKGNVASMSNRDGSHTIDIPDGLQIGHIVVAYLVVSGDVGLHEEYRRPGAVVNAFMLPAALKLRLRHVVVVLET